MIKPEMNYEEIELKAGNGMAMLILFIFLVLACIAAIIAGSMMLESADMTVIGTILLIAGIIYSCLCWIPFMGLKILKPREALVLTLFGKYIGTLKGEGFFYVNPFVTAVNPTVTNPTVTTDDSSPGVSLSSQNGNLKVNIPSKIISMKTMTLNNNKQKVNDELGNPVEIGVVVIWRVVNTAKAVFNVDNYRAYLSIQCDSSLRNIARLYPYDIAPGGVEMTLRGSSQEVAEKLKAELQSRVEIAGLEITEARITHLAYSPEIAAVMLQRQQASAIIDARRMIVDGAVGMVKMALDKLAEEDIVRLDDEKKAVLISNLLVVLCGNRDAQPIINSGTVS